MATDRHPRRPSARAPAVLRKQSRSEFEAEMRSRAQKRRDELATRESSIMKALHGMGRHAYSVEIAKMIGEKPSVVRGDMDRMERNGKLRSRTVGKNDHGGKTGSPRRYFEPRLTLVPLVLDPSELPVSPGRAALFVTEVDGEKRVCVKHADGTVEKLPDELGNTFMVRH